MVQPFGAHEMSGQVARSYPVMSIFRCAYGLEVQQYGELYVPSVPGPSPVVILIHGGFWRSAWGFEHMMGLAEVLARVGIVAWNIEYRRIDDVGGGWPGSLQDVAQATDYLMALAPTYNLDLRRVVVVGHSAGGLLALWSAARPRLPLSSPLVTSHTPLRLSAAISLAGAVDLEHSWRLTLGDGATQDFLGGDPQAVPERYAAASPAALLPLGVPQVLVHGSSDQEMPLEVSVEYARKAREAGDRVELVVVPEADHDAVIDPTSLAWKMTIEHIHQFLV